MKTKVPAAIALLVLSILTRGEAQEPSPGKPRQIAVNVLGEVNRPGRYLLPEGATALDALGAASGQSQEADLKRVMCIHATTGDKPLTDKIDMRAVLKGTQVAPVLHEGDSLRFYRQFTNIQF